MIVFVEGIYEEIFVLYTKTQHRKMESSSKRKRKDFEESSVPEERLLKKFEVLESRLMQLWETDSNMESVGSANASASGNLFFKYYFA